MKENVCGCFFLNTVYIHINILYNPAAMLQYQINHSFIQSVPRHAIAMGQIKIKNNPNLTFTFHPFAGAARNAGPIFTIFGLWGRIADLITLRKRVAS